MLNDNCQTDFMAVMVQYLFTLLHLKQFDYGYIHIIPFSSKEKTKVYRGILKKYCKTKEKFLVI